MLLKKDKGKGEKNEKKTPNIYLNRRKGKGRNISLPKENCETESFVNLLHIICSQDEVSQSLEAVGLLEMSLCWARPSLFQGCRSLHMS